MPAPRVKICGVRSERDLEIVPRAGVDAVGLICGVEHAQDAQDGGWGLVAAREDAEYKPARALLVPDEARELARARSRSNAACTAYAMLALEPAVGEGRRERRAVARGAEWLLANRTPRLAQVASSRGWAVFRERGIRAGESYTYRRVSTA